MQQQATGILTIHRLRTNQTVQLYLSANKGLYQLVSAVDKSISPSWADGNGPTITPNITPADVAAQATNRRWYKDGVQITKGDGIHSISDNGALTFLKSPVDTSNIHNITYTYKCDITTGGYTQTIEHAIQVLCRQGGDNSYWGHISAPNGTVLGKTDDGTEVTQIRLDPSLWSGSKELDSNQYTVLWYKTGAGTNDTDLAITSDAEGKWKLDGQSLIIYRDGVDSMAHFEAHFRVNNNDVEAEGIQVADNADTYFIMFYGEKNVYTGSDTLCTITTKLHKQGSDSAVKIPSIDKWSLTATDSERMNEYPASAYGKQIVEDGYLQFSMRESNMYVPNTGADHASLGAGAWLALDVVQADKSVKDVAVANTAAATPCDVVLTVSVTI